MYKIERNWENVNHAVFEDSVSRYDIPVIHPARFRLPENWISFNYTRTCRKLERTGVHFFVDDYQFMRIWTYPDKYTGLLSTFHAVMSPDFSMYTDFPRALQIYNHYRKHWCAAYWQYHGINVIPTIGWSDEESYEWCFTGEPVGGVMAVSAIGTQNNTRTKELFDKGYKEMKRRLKPDLIIFYGPVPEQCKDDPVITIRAYQEKLWEIKKGDIFAIAVNQIRGITKTHTPN